MNARFANANPSVAPSPEWIDGWEKLLASACDAIAATSPRLMQCVVLTAGLHGYDGEAREVMRMARELAVLGDLTVAFKIDGRALTVRFSRREGSAS